MSDDKNVGLYAKFLVRRVDGKDNIGQKHHNCKHFVLDLTHDAHAIPALESYAASCAEEYPLLSRDLKRFLCRYHKNN